MPNQKIFCNVPWTNLHMYWDGSFGMCGFEKIKPYSDELSAKYNIKNMSVSEWFQSDVMKKKRIEILGNNELSECSGCYSEEKIGYESKRIKENLKTIIFNDRLEKSYKQSHWYYRFESSLTNHDQNPPIDWHIDLGNECNLACKMCSPRASSKIASQYRKWNLLHNNFNNWTNDPKSFSNFLKSIDNIKIHKIHFMGGEPFISKKFKEIIDHLILNDRKEINISCVTNGTEIDLDLIEKLQFFKSFDMEISIESVDSNNHYIRQGCDTEKLKQDILFLKNNTKDHFHVVLRTVPQLLSINTYHKLILWAWENKLPIQGNPLWSPSYLSINVIPINLRTEFISNLTTVSNTIKNSSENTFTQLATGRDISRLDQQLIRECQSMIKFLEMPEPTNIVSLRENLAKWLFRWDQVYNLNPFEIYPEYEVFLNNIGYGKI